MSRRVVAIGDLNGSIEPLLLILRGLRLIDRDDKWRARNTHLVQLGDIFNRGGDAKETFKFLLQLQRQAPNKGSEVSIILANHEVMTVLGNEAYCSEAEYLSFASAAQRRAWPGKVNVAMRKLYRDHPPGGPIAPLAPRLEAWKAANVPGQQAMRNELGPKGGLGRSIRALPLAIKVDDTIFAHSAITPRWARLGISGLNQAAQQAWREAPAFYLDAPSDGLFRDSKGPLWNRSLVKSRSARVQQQVASSLQHLGARRMVVGHTMTRHLGGNDGEILTVQQGKIVCIDVGLGRDTPTPCAALLIDRGIGYEWTPTGRRRLWK